MPAKARTRAVQKADRGGNRRRAGPHPRLHGSDHADQVVHKDSGVQITDFSQPVADAIVEPSSAEWGIQVYEMGVVHAA
jgi:hypothetical protein